MNRIIISYRAKSDLACDGKCNKAWGITSRPKVQFSDDSDDIAYLSDLETGLAPVDPKKYEDGYAKPTNVDQIHNKWCIRECERLRSFEKGQLSDELIDLPDFSKRQYNQPLKHTDTKK